MTVSTSIEIIRGDKLLAVGLFSNLERAMTFQVPFEILLIDKLFLRYKL
jgi:hypothetical protein